VAPVIANHHPVAAPSFGGVPFSQAMVDGAPLGRAKPLLKLARTSHRRVDISTGSLSSHGESFATLQAP
jgi:hypothetical protein